MGFGAQGLSPVVWYLALDCFQQGKYWLGMKVRSRGCLGAQTQDRGLIYARQVGCQVVGCL